MVLFFHILCKKNPEKVSRVSSKFKRRCNALRQLYVMNFVSFHVLFLCVTLCASAVSGIDLSVKPFRTVPTTSCFSEGLAIANNTLYQSCGGHYDSNLRALDLQTGRILRSLALPNAHFLEGLTIAGPFLYVITWTTHTLFIFRSADLALVGEKRFNTTTGEGWGLTTDGRHLIMSDGSDTVTFFKFPEPSEHHIVDELVQVRSIRVHHQNAHQPVTHVNELEYAGGHIYANVWRSNTMLKFSPITGEITQTFDLSALASESARTSTYLAGTEFRAQDVVPNGIAYNDIDNTFVLAGKLWPHYYLAHLQDASAEEVQQSARSHRVFGLLVLICLFLLWLLAMFHGFCHNCFFAGTSYADRDFPYEQI